MTVILQQNEELSGVEPRPAFPCTFPIQASLFRYVDVNYEQSSENFKEQKESWMRAASLAYNVYVYEGNEIEW